jgi:hypothetical protein
MRGCRAVLVIAFMSIAGAGHSQEIVVPPLPIKPDDLAKYCIYANRIYSNGAQICVTRGTVSLGCEKGEWRVDVTKFGLDCRNEIVTTGERR